MPLIIKTLFMPAHDISRRRPGLEAGWRAQSEMPAAKFRGFSQESQ
jgi:hypothetical protein